MRGTSFFSTKPFYAVVTMESTATVKRQIFTIIKRFKFEELPSAVMPIFPEISWSYVRAKLIKNHKNFTVPNAVRILEEALDNLNLTRRETHDRLALLEVTDISRHSKRKIWYGYQLINPKVAVSYLGRQQIEESIQNEFELNNLKVEIKVLTYNSITYVYIREKRKKAKRQYMSTVFFALFLEHKYFFCSKKSVTISFIDMMANSLGYNKYKRIKLMGRDLWSLMRLLWIKQQGVLNAEDINRPPVYESASPIVQHNGIDYTQNKQRRDYGEQCFGEEPPTLESLAVKGPITSVQHNLSSISSLDIRMDWEFRSPNIFNFFKGLIEKRVFTLPLPDYVSNFMKLGKNELKLV